MQEVIHKEIVDFNVCIKRRKKSYTVLLTLDGTYANMQMPENRLNTITPKPAFAKWFLRIWQRANISEPVPVEVKKNSDNQPKWL